MKYKVLKSNQIKDVKKLKSFWCLVWHANYKHYLEILNILKVSVDLIYFQSKSQDLKNLEK